MPTMQKAFIIQGFTHVADAASCDLFIGNLEGAEAVSILHELRMESELQHVTRASHGDLSRDLANARNEADEANRRAMQFERSLNGAQGRIGELSRENIELQNKLADTPVDLKLLAMLCCDRVMVKHELGVNGYSASVEFMPKSIEMHEHRPQICGLTPNGSVRRFTSTQIISFTALQNDVEHSNVTLPDNA